MIELPVFPMTHYHPVHGAVTVNTAEDAARVYANPHDWFKTAAEADAHRTENEAAIVIHNARRGQIMMHEQSPTPGVVKHSVTHQETVDRQVEAAMAQAEAVGMPKPETHDETRGAELLA